MDWEIKSPFAYGIFYRGRKSKLLFTFIGNVFAQRSKKTEITKKYENCKRIKIWRFPLLIDTMFSIISFLFLAVTLSELFATLSIYTVFAIFSQRGNGTMAHLKIGSVCIMLIKCRLFLSLFLFCPISLGFFSQRSYTRAYLCVFAYLYMWEWFYVCLNLASFYSWLLP